MTPPHGQQTVRSTNGNQPSLFVCCRQPSTSLTDTTVDSSSHSLVHRTLPVCHIIYDTFVIHRRVGNFSIVILYLNRRRTLNKFLRNPSYDTMIIIIIIEIYKYILLCIIYISWHHNLVSLYVLFIILSLLFENIYIILFYFQ